MLIIIGGRSQECWSGCNQMNLNDFKDNQIPCYTFFYTHLSARLFLGWKINRNWTWWIREQTREKSFFAFNCSHCSPCLFSILNHTDKWWWVGEEWTVDSSPLWFFLVLDAPGKAMRGVIKSFFRFYCSHCSPLVFYQ